MTKPKELYKRLSVDFKKEENFLFVNRGEGMMQGLERNTKRVFLVNKKTREAWELISANGKFSFWDASAVEIASAFDLPDTSLCNVLELNSPYHFCINEFRDGIAYVSWTLQPDGRYYADEDGFGMEDDEEIRFDAFIDTQAHILIPFQAMDESLRALYRKQAILISRNREEVPYVCLLPEITIPVSENTNLAAHKEKLLRIINGAMFQFGSQAQNVYKNDEYKERLGVFTPINPTPEHFLSLTILGNAVKDEDEKYELTIITTLFKEGEEPQGCGSEMGTFTPTEIENIMSIEDNAQLILDDFLEAVRMLYSDESPKQDR